MASDITKIVRMFSEALADAERKRTTGYDTPAVVTRVDGQTAWVHIAGGVDETPARLTVSAAPGDVVQVRVSGGRAWLTGNATAPPTDDRMAIVANEAAQTAVSLTNITHAALETLDAKVAVIDSAYIDTATVNTLLAGYAKIDMANIDTANINKGVIKDLFTEVGLVRSATIVDGKITGYLDAVNVNCNNITAGTLVADRIAIRGSNQSLVYALNNYGQITSQQVNTLDGYVLTPRTINADRIIAGSITGNEIAASTITANKMNVTSLSSVSANIGTVTAGILTSEDWSYTSGIYPTAGMRISLNDKYIRTPDFAVVGGKVYAKGGDLAGWTINDYQIANYDEESTSTQYGVFVRAKESSGPATANTYHFGVYHRDYSGGSYGNWTMDFGVKHDGSVYATKGSISGDIITTGISASNISTGTLTAIAINNGNGTFSVSSAGVLNATSATISGEITATSGNIGGFSVENNYQIVYRDQMTAGTAGTQYATFMRAQESAGTPATGSTAAFGVVHRSYDGSAYGNWVSDFIVRHDGNVYCYGGALHIENLGTTNYAKIAFPGGNIGSLPGDGIYIDTEGYFDITTDNVSNVSSSWHLGTALQIYARAGLRIVSGGDTDYGGTSGNISIENTKALVISTSNATLNSSGQMEISSTLQTGGNINIVSTASAAYAVGVQNAAKKVQLYMASNGQMGIYNSTDSHYVICEDADNVIRMPQVYAKTNSGAANIYIDSYGRTYRSTASSKRYKKNIKPLEDWKSILDIPVVSFMYREGYVSKDDQRYGVSVPGLIAEDVAEHYAVAAEMSGGKVEDWNIRYIVPPMLAVEQDHERRIKALEEQLLRREAG